jgi:hypothetical protein
MLAHSARGLYHGFGVKPTLDTTILARLRTKSSPRFAVVLLSLLGFLLQSHVAQTHFHHCDQASLAQSSLGNVSSAELCAVPAADDEPRQPGRDHSPTSCALCQIAAHGGAAPLPAAALAVAAPQVTHLTPADQTPRGAVAALSHSWQSRAPPVS